MTNSDLSTLYKEVLDRTLKDDFRLPNLPDITMKVRAAIDSENTTAETLTQLISKDPSLTAHLIQCASSPIYRRPVPPKTLGEVIGLLGFSATNSLVMLHSVQNMIELKSTVEKHLFNHTWERLIVKTSLACFFAQKLGYRPVDQVQMATLLTEVGSLSVLSAMLETPEPPNPAVYFQMCRQYSKTLGDVLLRKWGVDPSIIKMLRHCGQWEKTWEEKLNLLDIANLSLYYTVLLTVKEPNLPDLETLAVYQKLPSDLRECGRANWLNLVTENNDEIQSYISSLK